MEEEKKQGNICLSVTFTGDIDIGRDMQKTFSSTKSNIELLNTARLWTDDYDRESVKLINEQGAQAVVFEVKSKIDGKIYIAKRLEYKIGGNNNTDKIQAAAEREIGCLRAFNHPMIMGIVDLVKD